MTLDEKIDEILNKYALANIFGVAQMQAYIDAKKAIKQLIEDEVNMDTWRVMASGE